MIELMLVQETKNPTNSEKPYYRIVRHYLLESTKRMPNLESWKETFHFRPKYANSQMEGDEAIVLLVTPNNPDAWLPPFTTGRLDLTMRADEIEGDGWEVWFRSGKRIVKVQVEK